MARTLYFVGTDAKMGMPTPKFALQQARVISIWRWYLSQEAGPEARLRTRRRLRGGRPRHVNHVRVDDPGLRVGHVHHVQRHLVVSDSQRVIGWSTSNTILLHNSSAVRW